MPFKHYNPNYEYLFQVLFDENRDNLILIHNQLEFEEYFGTGLEVTGFPITIARNRELNVGSGVDGDLNVTGVTTLTPGVVYNYNNVTIDPGATLDTQGCLIYVKGTLLNEGTITDTYGGGRGGSGGSGGSGSRGSGDDPPSLRYLHLLQSIRLQLDLLSAQTHQHYGVHSHALN